MAAIPGVPISGDHDVFISVDVNFDGRAISNLQLLVALTVTGTGFSFSGGLIGGRYLAGSTTTQQRKNAFAFLASPKDNAPAITSPNLYDFGEASPLNTFVGKVGLIWRRDGTLEYNPYEETVPTLVLDMGTPMDVSTGYFSEDYAQKGVMSNKEYEVVHKALKPDHLALLPDEEGACNWADGCGVRSNQKGIAMKVKEALRVLTNALAGKSAKANKPAKAKRHARGEDDDDRQIRADLIASDDTPFTPDDEEALRWMSSDALGALREQYLTKAEAEEEETTDTNEGDEEETSTNEGDEEETSTNEDGDEEPEANADDEEEPAAAKKQKKAAPKSKANKEKPVKTKKNCGCGSTAGLSAEDRAALAFAKKNVAEHRASLVEKVVANSKFTADELKTFSIEQLAQLAERLEVPAPNFSGLAVPKTHDLKDAPESVKAMTSPSVMDVIRANAKKKEAA